jgi:lysylphosphatidylglycerol synthetase-like protein (DUF2156 family)
MQIEVILTVLIGLFIMLIGFLVFKKKALFLVNYNSWTVFGDHQELLAKIFGVALFIIGLIITLLPLILGTENINPL